jgi:hypothetical protein
MPSASAPIPGAYCTLSEPIWAHGSFCTTAVGTRVYRFRRRVGCDRGCANGQLCALSRQCHRRPSHSALRRQRARCRRKIDALEMVVRSVDNDYLRRAACSRWRGDSGHACGVCVEGFMYFVTDSGCCQRLARATVCIASPAWSTTPSFN